MSLQKQLSGFGRGIFSLWKKMPAEGKIALILISLLLVVQIRQNVVPYEGGWEITKSLDSVKVNGVWYSKSNLPSIIQTGDWGTNTVRFDVDKDNEGLPDLQIYTSSPLEYIVNSRGEWVQATGTSVFERISKVIGDDVYFFDHHVFRQRVKVTAYCDADDVHMPYGEARGLASAIDAQVTVRVLDKCKPWAEFLKPDFEGDSGSYLFQNGWAAIMSMRIAESTAWYEGYSAPSASNPTGTSPITSGGVYFAATTTGDINMWLNDIDVAPTSQGSLPASVYFDVSGGLSPAFKQDAFLFIIPIGTTYYPVYFEYVVEVHVLTVAGYSLESGDMDDEFESIDYFNYALTAFGAALNDINAWLSSIFPDLTLIGVIVLVIVSLVLVMILKKILGR